MLCFVPGGTHPWYVFKGNPISKVNRNSGNASVVDYDLIPTPPNVALAFELLNRGPNYNAKLARRKIIKIVMHLCGI